MSADNPTWLEWSTMAREQAQPGWCFCRFAIRSQSEVGMKQMYGIVRDGFGIYSQSFRVCGAGTGTSPMYSLHHLRSGVGMCLFIDKATAVEAAELLLRASTDFDIEDPNPLWPVAMQIWTAAGLGISPLHAHEMLGDAIGPALNIWSAVPPEAIERPARLS